MKKESIVRIEYKNMERRKKLVQINTVCNNSTGRIMHDIQKQAKESGWETLSVVGRRKVYDDLPCERYGTFFSFWFHVGLTTLFDRHGHGSLLQTKRIVARLREVNPDVIHLHNLHGYYLHIPTLFKYLIEEYKGKVFWTFHDLWPITGHCAYYTMVNCDKWKTKCEKCPNKKVYPISFGLDCSKRNYVEKSRLFTRVKNLEIIVPSQWVADQVECSFLKERPVHIVANGINMDEFQYVEDESLYDKLKISRNKKIILGVSNIWEKRKGLNDFLELAKDLTEEYIIVLVGLSRRQIKRLPNNIIGIQRTEAQRELVALYSMADVLMNPSREETFSLITVEAIASGTPVIVLDTSAVKELVHDDNGVILHDPGSKDYIEAIKILEKKHLERDKIRSTVVSYSKKNMAEKVIELYNL